MELAQTPANKKEYIIVYIITHLTLIIVAVQETDYIIPTKPEDAPLFLIWFLICATIYFTLFQTITRLAPETPLKKTW